MADDNNSEDRRARRWQRWIEPHDQRIQQRKLSEQPAAEAQEASREQDKDTESWDPFVAFKHFVDSGIDRVKSRMAADMRTWHDELSSRTKLEDEQEEQLVRRWTGRHTGPLRNLPDTPMQEEREAAVLMLLRQALEKNEPVPTVKMAMLYDDPEHREKRQDVRSASPMLSFGGACYYKPETNENLPSTATSSSYSPLHRWLSVDWFKRDRYSPVTLEAHPVLGEYDTKWRNAFEDLLDASLDKQMASTDRTGFRPPVGPMTSAWRAPGLDWMLSLQCRGILPPQLPTLYECILTRNGHTRPSLEELVFSPMFPLRQHPFSLRELSQSNPEPWILRDKDVRSEFMDLASELKISPPASAHQKLECVSLRWARPHTDSKDVNDNDLFHDPVGHVRRLASRGELFGDSFMVAMIDALRMVRVDNDEMCEQIDEAENAGLLSAEEAVDAREWISKEDAKSADALATFDQTPQQSEKFSDLDMYDEIFKKSLTAGADETEDAVREGVRQEQTSRLQSECPDQVGRDISRSMRGGQSGCPDKLGRDITPAVRGRSGCPDEVGRELSRVAREDIDEADQSSANDALQYYREEVLQLERQDNSRKEHKSLSTGLSEKDNDEEDDDQGDLPGELWSPHRISREARRSLQAEHKESHSRGERPQILSALTTTQTTRAANGTVTTRVVLKRKFADGSEESHEDVHTYQEEEQRAPVPATGEKMATKNKGWFWS